MPQRAVLTVSAALRVCAGAHEKDMFTLIADSAIEAMSVVFEMTRDESALEKTLQVRGARCELPAPKAALGASLHRVHSAAPSLRAL